MRPIGWLDFYNIRRPGIFLPSRCTACTRRVAKGAERGRGVEGGGKGGGGESLIQPGPGAPYNR